MAEIENRSDLSAEQNGAGKWDAWYGKIKPGARPENYGDLAGLTYRMAAPARNQ